jgi:hypothetical protein
MRLSSRFGFGYHPLHSSSSIQELPMSIKTPRLTRDRCGVFCIRLVGPAALRQDIGKSELRRSLRTKDCAIAKQRALTLNLALDAALTNPKI